MKQNYFNQPSKGLNLAWCLAFWLSCVIIR